MGGLELVLFLAYSVIIFQHAGMVGGPSRFVVALVGGYLGVTATVWALALVLTYWWELALGLTLGGLAFWLLRRHGQRDRPFRPF